MSWNISQAGRKKDSRSEVQSRSDFHCGSSHSPSPPSLPHKYVTLETNHRVKVFDTWSCLKLIIFFKKATSDSCCLVLTDQQLFIPPTGRPPKSVNPAVEKLDVQNHISLTIWEMWLKMIGGNRWTFFYIHFFFIYFSNSFYILLIFYFHFFSQTFDRVLVSHSGHSGSLTIVKILTNQN